MRQFYSYLKEQHSTHQFRVDLKHSLQRKEAILVHTMGKVGSSSIRKSLKDLELSMPIYGTHFLNSERLEAHLKVLRQKGQKPDGHLVVSQCLQEVINKGISDINWKVITLVREPISRNVSGLFQNIDKIFPNFLQRYHSGSLSIQEVVNVFLADYPHELPLNWLDWEIKAVFGIDVFSVNFPKSDGYTIFHRNNIDLLLLRLESLADCSFKAFSEFLGTREFTLKKANDSSEKEYSQAYREFRKSLHLPQTYIEDMYQSKYVQHFYTQNEIELFQAKWSK